jgi:hypothetical protein
MMNNEDMEKVAKNIIEAKRLLEEVDRTPFAGVNANLERAMISIRQALFNLGKEEEKGD